MKVYTGVVQPYESTRQSPTTQANWVANIYLKNPVSEIKRDTKTGAHTAWSAYGDRVHCHAPMCGLHRKAVSGAATLKTAEGHLDSNPLIST